MVIFLGMLLPQLALIVVQHRRIHYLRGETQPLEKGHGSQFGLAFAPVLMAAGAQQACILAERMFASFLEEGSITMLSFAFRIVTIPLTLYAMRSEEHTSELQSLMRISYAVFCLKKKKSSTNTKHHHAIQTQH